MEDKTNTKMEDYLSFVQWCKNNIHLYDYKMLITYEANEQIPHSEFETNLVMFFLQTSRPSILNIVSPNNGRELDIQLNEWSGRVYGESLIFLDHKLSLYLGTVNANHYFFDLYKNRIFYTTWIDDQKMINMDYEFVIQHEIRFPPKKIDLKSALHQIQKTKTPRKEKISRLIDRITDCEIHCSNGIVKSNKMYLCMLNDFFYSYIPDYSEKSGVYYLKDYSTELFRLYINYGLVKDKCEKDMIYRSPMEAIKMGMFFQDHKFVKFVYDSIASDCDEESLCNLNEEIKYFFRLGKTNINESFRIGKILF